MLAAGQRPPEEFTRPEVADILIAAMQESSTGQNVPA
jgi:ATP sulfurylase